MLDGKYPSYYVALRVGRELQSLCVASDPERTTLAEMLDELKQKWFTFKSALTEKYVCQSCSIAQCHFACMNIHVSFWTPVLILVFLLLLIDQSVNHNTFIQRHVSQANQRHIG